MKYSECLNCQKKNFFFKVLFEIKKKKNFFKKLLSKQAIFSPKSDIFIKEMIGDHFTITHKNYEPRSLTIMIAKFKKI